MAHLKMLGEREKERARERETSGPERPSTAEQEPRAQDFHALICVIFPIYTLNKTYVIVYVSNKCVCVMCPCVCESVYMCVLLWQLTQAWDTASALLLQLAHICSQLVCMSACPLADHTCPPQVMCPLEAQRQKLPTGKDKSLSLLLSATPTSPTPKAAFFLATYCGGLPRG